MLSPTSGVSENDLVAGSLAIVDAAMVCNGCAASGISGFRGGGGGGGGGVANHTSAGRSDTVKPRAAVKTSAFAATRNLYLRRGSESHSEEHHTPNVNCK
jgi:hypothetical protein